MPIDFSYQFDRFAHNRVYRPVDERSAETGTLARFSDERLSLLIAYTYVDFSSRYLLSCRMQKIGFSFFLFFGLKSYFLMVRYGSLEKRKGSTMGLNLLSTSTYKIEKGLKLSVLTGVLHLVAANFAFQYAAALPSTDKLFALLGMAKDTVLAMLKGKSLCPHASVGCRMACLLSAGRGSMNSVRRGRLRKTILFVADRFNFKNQLIADIAAIERKAKRENLIPAIRLNGTSDIPFERIFPDIFRIFPNVQFYDYTKIANRHSLPANYDLTFSYSGLPRYQPFVQKAIAQGLRVAVVFRDKKKIPSSFLGLPCVDGDDSDIRHLDPAGCIVALYAKGKAKKDMSGFVVDNVHPVIQLKVA